MSGFTIDPLAVSKEITDSYRRYLKTSFSFQDRERQAELERALLADQALANGPILQATAPYATGRSLAELMDEGVLSSELRRMKPEDFPIERPLYKHQEEAIRKLVGGRNLMVATGTGSGKTECFLLPAINRLLAEKEAGTLSDPGVRILLLYPMNALANDQLKRLRELLRAFPEITFGRYVGDTKPGTNKATAHHRAVFGEPPMPNELVSREQMQDCPPHILITNFAMLEYLLLRPADTAFFDGPSGKHWKMVVLDEVHVYDGAKGAELGMLLRRLRGRVHQGQPGQLQVVGTSATLGQGSKAVVELAKFGHKLFDEPFAPSDEDPFGCDVVEPTREELVGVERWTLPQHLIVELAALWRNGGNARDLAALIAEAQPPESLAADDTVATYLHRVLRSERHVVALQRELERGSGRLVDISRDVFTGPSAPAVAVDLVDLCLAARPSPHDPPLIPARYHLLLKALEGAFICKSSHHPNGEPRMLLSRHTHCPACHRIGNDTPMFEVASCRKCGIEYLVGSLGTEQEFGLVRTIDIPTYLLPAEGLGEAMEDEDDAASAIVAEAEGERRDELCVNCGVLSEPGNQCACSNPERELVLRLQADNDEGALRSCPSCGGRSNASIVSRVLTGSEAPVAVIATSLYQALPPATGEASANIGAGRKLLSFADSVQDAAFFAPYLSRTYGRAVQRRLIWQVLSKEDEAEPLASLATRLRKRAEREQVLDEDKSSLNSAIVLHWLTAEALAVDRRQSLDGVGLAELTVAVPSKVSTPPALKRLGFTDDEARDLARLLLDSLRLAAAVLIPEDVDMKDPIFSPRNIVTQVHQLGTEYGLLSWSPSKGMNRRLDYLSKVLSALGADTDPRELLDDLWTEWFARPGGAWDKVLVKQNHRKHGTVYALDHEALTLQAAGPDHQPYRCDTCRQLWWRSIRGVCPTYRCEGQLGPAEFDDQDHYRHLYTEVLPIGMRAEEHTGQLETQYAASLQQEFIDGEVNVLSCSTTFELGVDVGEVQAVLMRNVPPSPANYVQRAGRAGRRAGSAALVVTFAQRRNHDLHYFAHPRDMVDGIVSPPIIEVRNPNIARRHLHAVAFASFLRNMVDRGEEPAKDVAGFFTPSDVSQYDRFVAWMRSKPQALIDLLNQSIPANLHRAVGLDDWSWVDQLVELNPETGAGWLKRAASDVRGDLQIIQQAIDEAIANNQLNRVSPLDRVRRTLSDRQLIQVLAQSGVLPKYGFPVDVALLDVARSTNPRARNLDLSRDLSQAVSMYAPGNKIVAAGVIWEPIALKRPPNGDFVRRWWGRCRDCEAFQVLLDLGVDDEPTCRVCESTNWKSRGKFVVPSFGFIGEASTDKPGERRPPSTATSSTFFDRYEGADPEPQLLPIGPGPTGMVELRHSQQAWITVISRPHHGHGFLLCNFCGALRDKPPATKKKGTTPEPHARPTGYGECDGTFHAVNLGHQYLTDAIELRLNPAALIGDNATESTLHALLAATRAVGITRDDMQGSTQPFAPNTTPGIVLFDGVPGGAGHAEHLAKNLPALFEAALDLVANCECGEDTSCYGCLRTYRNQFSHDQLVRGEARDTLRAVLGEAQT